MNEGKYKVKNIDGYSMGITHYDDTPSDGVLVQGGRKVFDSKVDALNAVKRTIKYRRENGLIMWEPEDWRKWIVIPA